ncbi:MAG: domain S-box protein [Solirubrobacterales bacterium]|nr:domain S-box protein [Solirubrobacterales bacterium]
MEEEVVDEGVESVGRFRRRRPAVAASVPLLRRELTEWARAVGVDDEHLQAVRLAVSEALTNAVIHAFIHTDPGHVELSAATNDDALEIRVTDDGSGMGPRPDSPGLGMGVPMIGKLCSTVDLGEGPDGTGTEVRMVFTVPGLTAPSGSRHEDLDDILDALAELGADEGFGGSDIGGLARLLVPRLADLCSVTLLDADGTGRRVGALVARSDGSPDPEATAWVMDFPLTAPAAPSLQAALDSRVSILPVDEAFARSVSPDPERAAALLDLGLAWWIAVPLRAGGRTVGSVAIAGRTGDPESVVSTLERVAAQAGGLVATARLVDDLRRSQKRLAQILGSLSEAVTVADTDGRFVYANQAAARLLGVDDPEAILRSEPGALAQRFHMTDEDGAPVALEDMPHRRLLRGGEGGSRLTRNVERATGRTLWLRTTSTPLDGGRLAVSVVQDLTAEKQAELQQRLLAEAGQALTSTLGQADTFERIAHLAVPAIADGCLLEEVADDGSLSLRLVQHIDPARARALRALRESHPASTTDLGGAGRAARGGVPDVVAKVTDELLQVWADDEDHLAGLRALGVRSLASLPLVVEGKTVGVLTLLTDASARAFGRGDIEVAQELAQRAAEAIDNARMHAERERTHRELEGTLRRLQILADAGFGGLIRGVDTRILEANDTFLKMVGYDDVDALPPWPQMTPPEWAAVDMRAIAQMREHGTADLFEKEYLRRDGSRVRVLVGATVAEPDAFEWICVVVDLTGRQAANAVSDAGLDRIAGGNGKGRGADEVAAVIGSLAAAVLIQRPGHGVVYANQAAADALGMSSPQEVIAAAPHTFLDGWDTFDEHGNPLTVEQHPSRRILDGQRSAEPLTLRSVNRRTGLEHWRIVRAWPVFEPDGSLAMVVVMTEDITETRRAQLMQRVFAEAGEILSSSTDYRETLHELAGALVPELADWCSIAMEDQYGAIRQVAVAHTDPERVEFARAYDEEYAMSVDAEGGSAEILRGGPPTLIPDISDALLQASISDPEQLERLRSLGMRSVMQVPLAPTGSAPIGVLSLINAESGRVFTDADLAIATELGRRAGTAVQNARLHEERAHIAATLQASLLPDELPDIPGFSLEAMYRPAGEQNWVGGDFYDAFAVPGGWMVIVGDVAGHGAEAAALTAQARHTLRAIGEAFGDPVRAVAHLNRLLVPRAEPALCTVCAVLLRVDDAGQATAAVTCAGHPLPYLVRGGVPVAVGHWGPLLGAWDSTFTITDVPLHDDDVLVLYTDGVLDARAGRERFGDARLEATLAPVAGARAAVSAVRRALDAFQTGEQADDTAIVAIQRCADRDPPG